MKTKTKDSRDQERVLKDGINNQGDPENQREVERNKTENPKTQKKELGKRLSISRNNDINPGSMLSKNVSYDDVSDVLHSCQTQLNSASE